MTYLATYSIGEEIFQRKQFSAKDRREARRKALDYCPAPFLEVQCFEIDEEKKTIKGRLMQYGRRTPLKENRG